MKYEKKQKAKMRNMNMKKSKKQKKVICYFRVFSRQYEI